jgi:hypothetical protein
MLRDTVGQKEELQNLKRQKERILRYSKTSEDEKRKLFSESMMPGTAALAVLRSPSDNNLGGQSPGKLIGTRTGSQSPGKSPGKALVNNNNNANNVKATKPSGRSSPSGRASPSTQQHGNQQGTSPKKTPGHHSGVKSGNKTPMRTGARTPGGPGTGNKTPGGLLSSPGKAQQMRQLTVGSAVAQKYDTGLASANQSLANNSFMGESFVSMGSDGMGETVGSAMTGAGMTGAGATGMGQTAGGISVAETTGGRFAMGGVPVGAQAAISTDMDKERQMILAQQQQIQQAGGVSGAPVASPSAGAGPGMAGSGMPGTGIMHQLVGLDKSKYSMVPLMPSAAPLASGLSNSKHDSRNAISKTTANSILNNVGPKPISTLAGGTLSGGSVNIAGSPQGMSQSHSAGFQRGGNAGGESGGAAPSASATGTNFGPRSFNSTASSFRPLQQDKPTFGGKETGLSSTATSGAGSASNNVGANAPINNAPIKVPTSLSNPTSNPSSIGNSRKASSFNNTTGGGWNRGVHGGRGVGAGGVTAAQQAAFVQKQIVVTEAKMRKRSYSQNRKNSADVGLVRRLELIYG